MGFHMPDTPNRISESEFTTQADILKKLNIQDDKGICSELSNLYADYRMGGSRDFLGKDAKTTYQLALAMGERQSSIRKEFSGDLGTLMSMNAAFFNHRKLFKTIKVPVTELKSQIEQLNAEHIMINYPTLSDNSKLKPYHQVYFGKTNNQYYYFNANIEGGERQGTSDQVLPLLTSDIASSVALDGRECLITKSI